MGKRQEMARIKSTTAVYFITSLKKTLRQELQRLTNASTRDVFTEKNYVEGKEVRFFILNSYIKNWLLTDIFLRKT